MCADICHLRKNKETGGGQSGFYQCFLCVPASVCVCVSDSGSECVSVGLRSTFPIIIIIYFFLDLAFIKFYFILFFHLFLTFSESYKFPTLIMSSGFLVRRSITAFQKMTTATVVCFGACLCVCVCVYNFKKLGYMQ